VLPVEIIGLYLKLSCMFRSPIHERSKVNILLCEVIDKDQQSFVGDVEPRQLTTDVIVRVTCVVKVTVGVV